MSTFQDLLWEAEFEHATQALEQTPIHAHTGDGCVFCATRTGEQAKTAAISSVTRDLEWWERANTWRDCLEHGYRFTADDLVAAVGKPTGSANQIGAILRTWSMAEWIEPVGVLEAKRRESHSRLLRVWQVTV